MRARVRFSGAVVVVFAGLRELRARESEREKNADSRRLAAPESSFSPQPTSVGSASLCLRRRLTWSAARNTCAHAQV